MDQESFPVVPFQQLYLPRLLVVCLAPPRCTFFLPYPPVSRNSKPFHEQELGTATGIPGSVLGLTLLAWGNSSGDLVTNLAVARAGFPGMAIAGSYGGPLFNVLLGIGLPMFYSSAR